MTPHGHSPPRPPSPCPMTLYSGPGPTQSSPHMYHTLKQPPDIHWHDYYPSSPLPTSEILPAPPVPGPLPWTTKWKRANPNPKTTEGIKALYGGGMYPGMMPGMAGMGMGYPAMGMGMGGMGMGMGYPGMGMGGMGMMPMMSTYGMPRYPGGMYQGYGGGYGYGMYDPMMGYGGPPASNFVDDFPDAHRVEHAYRQSMPDNYGIGMATMPGAMALNNNPGAAMMLYGRGMYPGWYA